MSDNIIEGTDKLFALLSILYTTMIRHGYECKELNTVTLVPIPKDKRKSLSNSDNYRAIAPNNVLIKLFDYIILDKFGDVFETNSSQFAYKSGFSPTMCSFLASEAIQYYINGGSSVYAVLLDCSKAFDVVKYDRLFNSLLKRNMCPLIIKLILNLYTNSLYCVKWNGETSETFKVRNGVKQGGVISPFLFTLFLDDLIKEIKESKMGCYIGDKCASIFVFADDILLLCPTRSSAQKLLDMCHNFAISVGLKFNAGKCKFIVFGVKHDVNIIIRMGTEQLKCVDEEYHVGHLLSCNRYIIDHRDIISGLYVKTNCLARTLGNIGVDAKRVLFKAQCCSLFGIEVMDINKEQFNQIQVKWRKCIRYILGLHPRTHNSLIPHIIESPSVEHQIYSRMLCFFSKGLQHDDKFIAFFFRNCMAGLYSYMSKNIYNILNRLGLSSNDLFIYSQAKLKRLCKSGIEEDWRVSMIKELLLCRDGLLECNISRLEIIELLNYLCTN